MDAQQAANCLMLVALKWPHRYMELRSFIELPLMYDPTGAALWEAIQQASQSEIPASGEGFRDRVMYTVRAQKPAYAGNCQAYIDHVVAQTQPDEAYCVQLLKGYAAQSILSDMPDADDSDALQFLQSKIESARSAFTESVSAEFVDLFADNGRFGLTGSDILPCSNFLMEPFGGLFPEGRLLYVVMPRKAGKTLSALQLSKDLVIAGMDVLYMNFEQTFQGDLATRIYLLTSESGFSAWNRVRSFEDLAPPVRATLEANREAWREHFMMLCAEEIGEDSAMQRGADSVQRLIQERCLNAGRRVPHLVIIDWWRELWERCVGYLRATSRRSISDTEIRQLEINHFKKLKLMGQAMGTRILVYHQLRSQIAGSTHNLRNVSANDAAENKALTNMADAAIVSTTKDEQEKSVMFKLDFSRFCDGGWTTKRIMDGDRQLFIPPNAPMSSTGEPEPELNNEPVDMGGGVFVS